MATKNLPDTVDQSTGEIEVYTPPSAWEVVDRGPGDPIEFQHHGDSFQGIYMGREIGTDKDGDQFPIDQFTGADGKSYVIFSGASLSRGMKKVERGQWARVTYVFDLDIGKPSPMKVFTVEVGR